ncbi:RNA polymerase sigma factor [Sphingobacterium faecale]|uniref:Sigma-70 family RNA polymerase sigma factor n=1 Tax=Sphingobacterium faecale TaxID=2803775 RepID=A0ABS1R8W2_9SPHI|nr:sigma-70 family RNA polymerase sigma factor [Sphingobacterium faecale]MBL1410422.1 sigma-70 family RNA polymerase sigma factor [Sphingobacterium faecale]
MKYIDEQQLLKDFLEGEEHAFKYIFNTYYKRMCLYARSFVDESREAEDLAGDAFIRIWEGKKAYESVCHLKAAIYQTVRRLGINNLEATKRRNLRANIYYEEHSQIAPSQLQEIVFVEAMAELYHAIEALPNKAQEIIRLTYLEGKSNLEVAEIMGINVQTVKNQKLRALTLLRSRISKNTFHLLVLGFLSLEKF